MCPCLVCRPELQACILNLRARAASPFMLICCRQQLPCFFSSNARPRPPPQLSPVPRCILTARVAFAAPLSRHEHLNVFVRYP
jgi:hypothetical protein